MGGNTIEPASKEDVDLVLKGVTMHAESILNKKVFSDSEKALLVYFSELIANKNQWINFYEKNIHKVL